MGFYQTQQQLKKLMIIRLRTRVALATTQQTNYIILTEDNIINGITVNGNPVALPVNDPHLNDWPYAKNIVLPSLGPGDVLSIDGINKDDYSPGNPGALIATLHYFNAAGVETVVSTNPVDWKCDGDTPFSFGQNSPNVIWGFHAEWPTNAEWIWNADVTKHESKCTYTIPYPARQTCAGKSDVPAPVIVITPPPADPAPVDTTPAPVDTTPAPADVPAPGDTTPAGPVEAPPAPADIPAPVDSEEQLP